MHDDKPQELGGGAGGGNEERLDGEAEDHEQYMERKGQAEALRYEGRLVGGVCEGASEGVHRQVRSLCPRLANVGGGLDRHAAEGLHGLTVPTINPDCARGLSSVVRYRSV